MLEQYKTVYQGGTGEVVEKKFPFYRNCAPGKFRGRGAAVYRRNEKEILGRKA